MLAIIERAVVTRFEQQASWKEVERQSTEGGTPVLRTLRHWCRAYAGHASTWLAAVQQVLAQQDSPSPWLDPQGEALQAGSCAPALLRASLHLLAWAKTQWPELAEYGLNNRLKFLWLWGSGRELGRLV